MLAFRVLLTGSAVAATGVKLRQTKPIVPYRQALRNFRNTQYFADINIGGQKLEGLLDTGSFEVLVRSTRCDKCKHPSAPYNRALSKTYKKNGTIKRHVFGSGPCISMQGFESVSVGPMKASNQSFWEITSHKIPALNSAKFAAIVGIGPHYAPNSNDERTLLMSFGVDEFSVCLQRSSGAPGFLTWGPVASEGEKRDFFATVPVIGNLHWAAKMSSVMLVKPSAGKVPVAQPSSVCGGQGCAAVVDSGTSLIAAPSSALLAISEAVGPIREDCSNLHELPQLGFTLGGKYFELPPRAYVLRIAKTNIQADDVWDLLFFKPKLRKRAKCIPAFMQLDMMSSEGPVWILGMPFLRYYHTSFNRRDKQMHFARAGQGCEAKPYSNRTALLSVGRRAADDYEPTDIDLGALIPPGLSSLLDDGERGHVVL